MKTIVFCADGTWNGPGEPDDDPKDACPTNVFKLYVSLAGRDVLDAATYRSANEQERRLVEPDGTVAQVAKYLHGVGDSDNFLVKLLGGTLGAGVIARIVRGYTFVSRSYEPGDRIVLVGFSRGAYTVRALAGMIAAQGLLDASANDLEDRERAYRLASGLWADYRQHAAERLGARWLNGFRSLLEDLPAFFSRTPSPAMHADVTIDTVAVWDTVGALGIPAYAADGGRLDVFRFCDLALSPKVRLGLHAVSRDEARADFTPTLWDADPRIEQLVFAGAHADVGGGYPMRGDESGLSDIALDWMRRRLAARQVLFDPGTMIPCTPDARGVAHQPWAQSPWRGLPRAARAAWLAALPEHPSVAERRAAGPVRADPSAAPAAYGD